MSVLTIGIVGGGIAMGFYYLNKDAAARRPEGDKKLRESTAMVFVLSIGVLLLANFLGMTPGGGGGGDGNAQSPSATAKSGGAGVGAGAGRGGGGYTVPLDYVIGGDPPF